MTFRGSTPTMDEEQFFGDRHDLINQDWEYTTYHIKVREPRNPIDTSIPHNSNLNNLVQRLHDRVEVPETENSKILKQILDSQNETKSRIKKLEQSKSRSRSSSTVHRSRSRTISTPPRNSSPRKRVRITSRSTSNVTCYSEESETEAKRQKTHSISRSSSRIPPQSSFHSSGSVDSGSARTPPQSSLDQGVDGSDSDNFQKLDNSLKNLPWLVQL